MGIMIPFLKMHGCGNDFVMLDAREMPLPALNWQKIADRRFGIGCDQIVILGRSVEAHVFMRIINSDGSEVASCGNASRCVGWLIRSEHPELTTVRIETLAGVIEAIVNNHTVTVDMGEPRLEWNEIPLSEATDTLHMKIGEAMLQDPVGVSMGNPHAVFFVPDIHEVPLAELGPVLEHHALFPERANIGIAHVAWKNEIHLRVWERGAGLTLACGTGACAALVAAVRLGLAARKAQVHLPGGLLLIEWQESDNHVLMTGEVAMSYQGAFDETSYAAK